MIVVSGGLNMPRSRIGKNQPHNSTTLGRTRALYHWYSEKPYFIKVRSRKIKRIELEYPCLSPLFSLQDLQIDVFRVSHTTSNTHPWVNVSIENPILEPLRTKGNKGTVKIMDGVNTVLPRFGQNTLTIHRMTKYRRVK